jgi:ATP-dependent DNA helicase RecQ
MLAEATLTDPAQVLRQVFGFPGFRGQQEPAVSHVVAGGDALVLMPTGGGKSICYQVPALCRAGTAVIVSPLIALMDDQVAALRQLGINAGALHSEIDPAEARSITRDLIGQQLDLLYVSPERLLSNGTMERLSHLRLALFAVDEAHCVSAWGHEFRPEYRELARIPGMFPGVPRIALTATADPRTQQDILGALRMEQAKVFVSSFHRPNLRLSAAAKVGETAQLFEFLQRHKGECGIVYCGSRAKTERMAAKLNEKGFAALPFHAGLDPMLKRQSLTRFRSGEPLVVVATIAFGMGIDRPDVRFVVHLDMPDSPEAYYQQIGRAGRDGDPADTLLLFGGQDVAQARHWLAQSAAPDARKRVMRTKLEEMVALTEAVTCRTRSLLTCFGEALACECGHCDNCEAPPITADASTEAQMVLSAVYRTEQLFGAGHIVAVLRGERTEGVLRHRHDRLRTFGVGAAHAASYWRGLIRQLIALRALDVDTEGHGGLFLVQDEARPILRGEVKVMLRQDRPRPTRTERPERSRPAAAVPAPSGGAPEGGGGGPLEGVLYEALRLWRSAEAKGQSIPPYVIFHDSVLRDIAGQRPATLAALAQIKGVGASKLERYGRHVLGVLGARLPEGLAKRGG